MALNPRVIWTPFGPIYPEAVGSLFLQGGQRSNETNLDYGTRQSVQGASRTLTQNPLTSPLNPANLPFRMVGQAGVPFGSMLGQAITYATDTPAQEQARGRREQQRTRQAQRRAAAARPAAEEPIVPAPNDPASQVFARMIQQESGGRHWARPGVPLTSPAGAVGVAQVMPGTAPEAARLAGLPYDERRYRTDPGYNLRLGQAYYYDLLRQFGNDPIMAAAAYNAGPARLRSAMQRAERAGNPTSWASYLPAETQNYIARVGGGANVASALGTPPPGMGPYMQGFQQGMSELERVRQAAMTPLNATFTPGPRPDLPAPEELQAPDFTASNAAFEQARPNKAFEDGADRNRFLRQNFFRGIGEALMSITPGRPLGFGELLMRAGAGALMGRSAGEDRARQMDREFDQAMQRYNAALAERNEQQAVAATNVLNQNVAQRNQHALRQFEVNFDEWRRNNRMEIVGTNLVTYSQGENGQVRLNTTPIPAMVDAAIAGQRAQAYFSLGSASQQQAQWNWSSTQAQALQIAALAMQGGGQTGAEGAVYGLAQNTAALVDSGTIRSVIPPNIYNTYVQQAYEALGISTEQSPLALATDPNRGALPDALQERVNSYLTNRLVIDALHDPQGALAQSLLGGAGAAAGAVARVRETRTSRRTDYRGRTTTTESVGN